MGDVYQVATGNLPRAENGHPVQQNLIENRNGASTSRGNVRQIAGNNLDNLQK